MSDFNSFTISLAPAHVDANEYIEPDSVAFATAMNVGIFDSLPANFSDMHCEFESYASMNPNSW